MLSSDSHAYSCFCTLCISVTIRLVRIAETFVCDICGEDIEKVRYNCNKCDDYDICEPCYFRRTDDDEDDEEAEVPKHPHKLTAIKLPVKAALMFAHHSSTGNTVYVGNFACALPGSPVLKANKIGAVLSLIELPHPNKEIAPLARLYSNGADSTVDGVVYHHLAVADIANPALLGPEGALSLFPETTSFISEALRAKRNVLVHCELGQRRCIQVVSSPIQPNPMTHALFFSDLPWLFLRG